MALLPLALLLLVMLHLVALRQTGSNNPDGIEIKEKLGPDGHPLDGIPVPSLLHREGHRRGRGIPAVVRHRGVLRPDFRRAVPRVAELRARQSAVDAQHIAPAWYFTPYYAILRAVPNQRLGALLLVLAVVLFLFLPWLDRSPVKSMRYKGWVSRTALALFTVAAVVARLPRAAAGGRAVRGAGALFTIVYFLFFMLMPFYTRLEPVKPVPERVTYHAH